jgi:PEP-CTERM motif
MGSVSILHADNFFITDVGTGGIVLSGGGAGYDNVLGYELKIGSAPISLTALGTFDNGSSSGVSSDMLVGVWDSVGTLLSSVVVAPGAGSVGDFSYAFLTTPLTLEANTDYYFGSRSDSDYGYTEEYLRISSNVVSSNVASYLIEGGNSTGGYPESFASEAPIQNLGDTTPIMGPNFEFKEIPEPSAYAMMLGGLAILGFRVRRKLA